MRNPFRGLFRPTPEDRAALDVVREEMDNPVRRWSVYDGTQYRKLTCHEMFGYGARLVIYEDWSPLSYTQGLWISGREPFAPLSRSARNELRRMVRAFRVRLAMEATKARP